LGGGGLVGGVGGLIVGLWLASSLDRCSVGRGFGLGGGSGGALAKAEFLLDV
jgi:hypothetical protein